MSVRVAFTSYVVILMSIILAIEFGGKSPQSSAIKFPSTFIKEANLYLEHVSNLSYSLKDKQKAMKESGKKYEEIHEIDMEDTNHFNKKMDSLITSHLDRDFKKGEGWAFKGGRYGMHSGSAKFKNLAGFIHH